MKGHTVQKSRTAIVIIAWWLIGSSLLALLVNILASYNPTVVEVMSKSPMPLHVRYAFVYATTVASVAAGAGLLKRQNWARWLYIIWSLITFVISFAVSIMKTAMLPGLVIFVVITYLLFRPEAKEYFVGKETKKRSAFPPFR